MSAHYTCDIYLEASFNQETLLRLLKRGKKLDFIYFYIESYSDDLDIATDMSPEEALNYFNMGQAAKKNDFDFPQSLVIQCKNTIFTLSFYEKEGTNLHFFVLENPWKKICGSLELIDFGRYVKLWIDMCDDFCIHKIATSID